MPMTAGMVYFRDPKALDAIAYHARYVNRKGSVDLGIKTLEGSRESSSLILDAALKIMGARGYGLMIDHGIRTAKAFAEKIENRPLFQLVSLPASTSSPTGPCPWTSKRPWKAQGLKNPGN
jgi:glutamate/tyrosine decarboxylase-like PLP-dependent enzyme